MIFKPNVCLVQLLAVVLASCTSSLAPPPVDTSAMENRALQAIDSGNLRAAAEIYQQIAMTVSGSQRSDFLIESASLSIDAGDLEIAQERLATALADATDTQRQMLGAQRARVALAQGRPADAISMVEALGPQLPTSTLIVALAVRGTASFAIGEPTSAVAALVERELWLNDAERILANQRAIWDGLRDFDSSSGERTGDAEIDGWLDLGPISRIENQNELRRELLEWRVSHLEHAAATVLLADLLLDARQTEFPLQIALLLPINSGAREAAVAIRDGFIAAHFASSYTEQTTVRVYDTSTQGAAEAYLRAQLDGADFIVGPLRREEVEIVGSQAGFVPTLALNFTQSEGPFPSRFYQFALSPDDEAIAVARRAIATGATRAAAMMQSDEFGSRIADSFQLEFESLGGEVVSVMPYETALRDFSSRISALVNIDRSYQRHRRLAANLGQDVAFEPRRRQDIDIIFLSADAATGRLLAPQLEYFYAGDLPTYAISEIYEPGLAIGNRDLDGIIFPDVPWLVAPDSDERQLASTLNEFWPRRSIEVPRFYGMGLDAYSLVDALHRNEFIAALPGVSGTLTMDLDGKIHRDLPFAQFRNGSPELLPPIPSGSQGSGGTTTGE